MKPFQSFYRTLKLAVLAVAWWIAVVGTAMAIDKPGEKSEGGSVMGDWTMGYFLVILGIVLGLLFILRSSNRRERERPEGYVSKNIMQDE